MTADFHGSENTEIEWVNLAARQIGNAGFTCADHGLGEKKIDTLLSADWCAYDGLKRHVPRDSEFPGEGRNHIFLLSENIPKCNYSYPRCFATNLSEFYIILQGMK